MNNNIELGQAMFGCPVSEFGCPSFIEAGLQLLAETIEISEGNRTQESFAAPTRNSGTHYSTDVFDMHCYYWGDCTCEADEEEPCKPDCLTMRANFKCGNFEVHWYKYLGRGMSMNQKVDANAFFEIIDRCLDSIDDHYGEG